MIWDMGFRAMIGCLCGLVCRCGAVSPVGWVAEAPSFRGDSGHQTCGSKCLLLIDGYDLALWKQQATTFLCDWPAEMIFILWRVRCRVCTVIFCNLLSSSSSSCHERMRGLRRSRHVRAARCFALRQRCHVSTACYLRSA